MSSIAFEYISAAFAKSCFPKAAFASNFSAAAASRSLSETSFNESSETADVAAVARELAVELGDGGTEEAGELLEDGYPVFVIGLDVIVSFILITFA